MSDANEELSLDTDIASVHAMLQRGERMLLLDCREQNEFDAVRIEGAKLVPMSELQGRVGELAGHKSDRIVVYCHLGGRSHQVAAWLRSQDFPQAQSMSGGIDQWAVEIDPSLPRY